MRGPTIALERDPRQSRRVASVEQTEARRSWPDRIRTGWCEFRRPVRYSEVEATQTTLLSGAEV